MCPKWVPGTLSSRLLLVHHCTQPKAVIRGGLFGLRGRLPNGSPELSVGGVGRKGDPEEGTRGHGEFHGISPEHGRSRRPASSPGPRKPKGMSRLCQRFSISGGGVAVQLSDSTAKTGKGLRSDLLHNMACSSPENDLPALGYI